MSNVIQFLEAAGGNAALSAGEYAATVSTLDIDDATRQALLARDHYSLNAILEGREKLFCLVCTPDSEETPDDADGDGVPDQEEPPLQN